MGLEKFQPAQEGGSGKEREKRSLEEIKAAIQVPSYDEVKEVNPRYTPTKRLQAVWESHIKFIENDEEKKELEELYDLKAHELWSEEINVPSYDEVKEVNPRYVPKKRLQAIIEAIQQFPFADDKTRDDLLQQAQEKMIELGA